MFKTFFVCWAKTLEKTLVPDLVTRLVRALVVHGHDRPFVVHGHAHARDLYRRRASSQRDKTNLLIKILEISKNDEFVHVEIEFWRTCRGLPVFVLFLTERAGSKKVPLYFFLNSDH